MNCAFKKVDKGEGNALQNTKTSEDLKCLTVKGSHPQCHLQVHRTRKVMLKLMTWKNLYFFLQIFFQTLCVKCMIEKHIVSPVELYSCNQTPTAGKRKRFQPKIPTKKL